MTVREMLGRMSSAEFTEWVAYYSIEPFGEFRRDLQAGIVASTLANIHGPRRPLSPADFVLDFTRAAEEISPEDQERHDFEVARQITLAMGGEAPE